MGLFIGASILTILELFDYVYEVIKVSFMVLCLVVKVSKDRKLRISCIKSSPIITKPIYIDQSAV